jgi:anoctamin-1
MLVYILIYLLKRALFLHVLQITVAVGAVFGVVLYRMASVGPKSMFHGPSRIILIPATAAIINLVCIMLLNYVSLVITA